MSIDEIDFILKKVRLIKLILISIEQSLIYK